MNPQNPFWQTFNGEPITGRVPARMIVHADDPGQVMDARQQVFVANAFRVFCTTVNNSAHPGGYHAQHRTGPDGTKIRMESISGAQRVFVRLPGSEEEEAYLMAVFPASDEAPLGAKPPVDDYSDPTPAAILGADKVAGLLRLGLTAAGKIRPYKLAAYDDRNAENEVGYGELNESYPGTVDWSCRNETGAKNLVVSWWNVYHGRYVDSYPTSDSFGDTTFDKLQMFGPRAYANYSRFGMPTGFIDPAAAKKLWINGKLVAYHPVANPYDPNQYHGAIVGACVHKTEAETKLRVLYHTGWRFDSIYWSRGLGVLTCYEEDLTPSALSGGNPIILANGIWNSGGTDIAPPLQPMHCNSSGTKAVYVRDEATGGVHFSECALSDGAITAPDLDWAQNTTTTRPQIGTEHYVSGPDTLRLEAAASDAHLIREETCSASWTTTAYRVMAADYQGDALQYIWSKTVTGKSRTINCSRTQTGDDTGLTYWTHVIEDTSSCTFVDSLVFEVFHSDTDIGKIYGTDGTLTESRAWSGSGSLVKAPNGGLTRYTHSGTGALDVTFARTGNDADPRVQSCGVAGDLRVASFDLNVTRYNTRALLNSYTATWGVVGYRDLSGSTVVANQVVVTKPPNPGGYTGGLTDELTETRMVFLSGELFKTESTVIERFEMTASDNASVATAPSTLGVADVVLSRGPMLGSPIFSASWSAVPSGFEKNSQTFTYNASGENIFDVNLYKTERINNVPLNELDWARYMTCTSTSDGKLYARLLTHWPSRDGLHYSSIQVGEFVPVAEVYDRSKNRLLVDLNLPNFGNPCPGDTKVLSGLMFIGKDRRK